MTERETQNAKKLLAGAMVFGSNAREGFASHYPTLANLSTEEWDSLLTIAGIGAALLLIPSRYGAAEQKEITSTVLETVCTWNADAVQSLADFINFVTAQVKEPANVPDVIGSWVVRDLKLEQSESSAPHVVGTILVNTFAGWWDQ